MFRLTLHYAPYLINCNGMKMDGQEKTSPYVLHVPLLRLFLSIGLLLLWWLLVWLFYYSFYFIPVIQFSMFDVMLLSRLVAVLFSTLGSFWVSIINPPPVIPLITCLKIHSCLVKLFVHGKVRRTTSTCSCFLTWCECFSYSVSTCSRRATRNKGFCKLS